MYTFFKTYFNNLLQNNVWFTPVSIKNISGGAGYRSRYLSHAKRALYHLSYAP